tara:strand:- start:84 stop:1373 length:1290 start_codon:yes stop_codon:yes gene_type:complete
MSSDSPVKFKEAKLHSATGSNDYDIRAGIVAVDYYEDLLKPGTNMTLSYRDTGDANGKSVFDALPIESRVKISLTFEGKGFEPWEVDVENYLLVKSSGAKKDSKQETVTLGFITKDCITNFDTQIKEKFEGPISKSVEKMLRENLGITKNIDSERTQHSYEFRAGSFKNPKETDPEAGVPRDKRAFDTIIPTLAKKAIPERGDTEDCGYLFYEDYDGYHFRSMFSLMQEKPVATYFVSNVNKSSFYRDNQFVIMDHKFISTGESETAKFNSLGGGRVATTTTDLVTGKTTKSVATGSQISLGSEDIKVNKRGRKTSTITKTTPLKSDNSPDYRKEAGENYNFPWEGNSIINYNRFFNSQKLSVTVPFNPRLRVGNIIEINFPEKNPLSNDKRIDEKISGKYIIKELNHSFTGNDSLTRLMVLRNSFGRT